MTGTKKPALGRLLNLAGERDAIKNLITYIYQKLRHTNKKAIHALVHAFGFDAL